MADVKIGGDLRPTPKDDRDFALGDIIKQIDISEVPATDWDFYTPLEIKDQRATQECTGHGVVAALEAHEGAKLNPSWQFAKIKQMLDDPTDTGADLRTAMKSGLKAGAVEKEWCNMGTDREDGAFLADIENYPPLEDKAEIYKQMSYVEVSKGKYDLFDNIRAYLWAFRNEYPVVVTGTTWRDGWTYTSDGIIPKEESPIIGGHCIAILPAQKIINGEPYLKVQNSYGTDFGDHGFNWFPREVINRDFTYGAYVYHDRLAEEIKQIVAVKVERPWWKRLLNLTTWKKATCLR